MKTFLCLLALVAVVSAASEFTTILATRDIDDWLTGVFENKNLTCCNKCPPPKVHLIKHWTTKIVPINIPKIILKPVPRHNENECPAGFKKIATKKCVHEITIVDNQPCPVGYTRIGDKKCVKTILLEKCSVGFKYDQKKSKCVKIVLPPLKCPNGYVRVNNHQCVQVMECPTKGGWFKNSDGNCVRTIFKCPKGYKKVGRHGRCIPKNLACPTQICETVVEEKPASKKFESWVDHKAKSGLKKLRKLEKQARKHKI
jgi:hypothetical protein